jgi:Fe-S-cluster containining protein
MIKDLSWLNSPLQMWVQNAVLWPVPPAPSLDCHGCTRANRAKGVIADRWRKRKCCTFQPFTPNFLLGAILETQKLPHFSQAVNSPLGLFPTSEYRRRYSSTHEDQRGENLLCAFFDKSNASCRVWQNRPSECAVYFCQETRFFKDRSADLFDLENAIAQMALIHHGWTAKEVERLLGWMDWSDADQVGFCWKHYKDREQDFYHSCWHWAKALTLNEIYSWLEPSVQARFDTWICIP